MLFGHRGDGCNLLWMGGRNRVKRARFEWV